MSQEGNDLSKVKDLSPVKVKKIKPSYRSSNHKIFLGNRLWFRLKIAVGLIIILVICYLVSNSFAYNALRLAFSIKNQSILVGFQNSAELRPTGGFWGSFGIWKIKNNVSKSEFLFETNPYKNDNKILKTSSDELPEPLKQTYIGRPQSLVNANWQRDFPQTAKNLEWFLWEGWNERVDGTLAISSIAIIDLLRITGPVILSDQTEVNADNFSQVMSNKIDSEYWQSPENIKINEPKTILKDLFPILFTRVRTLGLPQLYRFITTETKKGRIIAYFNNDNQEKIAKKLNISAEVKPYQMDYLSINSANINGGKSSLNVNQSVDYRVEINKFGSSANLSITRSLNNNWPKILNRNYIRIFAPLGSKLTNARLADEDVTDLVSSSQDNALACFGLWFSVSPGESQTLLLKYDLPQIKQNGYSLLYQKQPGTLSEKLKITVNGRKIQNGYFDQLDKNFGL